MRDTDKPSTAFILLHPSSLHHSHSHVLHPPRLVQQSVQILWHQSHLGGRDDADNMARGGF